MPKSKTSSKSQPASKSRQAPKSQQAPKPRNTVSRNPLLRKSHVHATSKKAERAQAKKDLNKELTRSDD